MDPLKSEFKKFNKEAEKMQKGDKAAAERIFNDFSPKVFRFFMIRTGQRETAEDLTQEVFLKLVDKVDTFDSNAGNFAGWFWQIAKNTLIDYFRQKKSVSLDPEMIEKKSLTEKHNITEKSFLAKIEVEEVLKIVGNFGEEEQEIFSLRFLSEMSYKEISRLVNKSEGNLRVITHRIIKKIQKNIY